MCDLTDIRGAGAAVTELTVCLGAGSGQDGDGTAQLHLEKEGLVKVGHCRRKMVEAEKEIVHG